MTGTPTGTWTLATLTDNLQKNKSIESIKFNKILKNYISSTESSLNLKISILPLS
jgi:hypothetical protein